MAEMRHAGLEMLSAASQSVYVSNWMGGAESLRGFVSAMLESLHHSMEFVATWLIRGSGPSVCYCHGFCEGTVGLLAQLLCVFWATIVTFIVRFKERECNSAWCCFVGCCGCVMRLHDVRLWRHIWRVETQCDRIVCSDDVTTGHVWNKLLYNDVIYVLEMVY